MYSSLILLLSLFTIARGNLTSRLLEDDDSCAGDTAYPIQQFSCLGSVIGDERFEQERNTQCRTACELDTPDFLLVTHLDLGCPLCQDEGLPEYIFLDPEGFKHICIPRGKCIESCGPEQPGCVYTGSCTSQVCFQGADSNKFAQVSRYTHRGPGTILVVDNNPGEEDGTLISTSTNGVRTLTEVIDKGEDYCATRDVRFSLSSASCTLSGDKFPISDGRGRSFIDPGQCRIACEDFDWEPYEVVRVATNCGFCNSPESDQWYSDDDGESERICIPRNICIEQCGPEGYGCVYTGSCQSRLCFSGIASKKPALFSSLNDDADTVEISVDNSGGPINVDPPVFTELGLSGDAESIPPSQEPTILPLPSSTPEEGNEPENEIIMEPVGNENEGTSIWVWLGPVVVGIAFIVIAVMVVVVRRRKDIAAMVLGGMSGDDAESTGGGSSSISSAGYPEAPISGSVYASVPMGTTPTSVPPQTMTQVTTD